MNKTEKQTVVENLKNAFSAATIVVIGENAGITAAQSTQLRKNIRKADGHTIVTKNTLAKLGAEGTSYEKITSFLKGPTVVMYSNDDPVALAKTAVDFAKDNVTLKLSGGAMGSKALDIDTLKALAALPPLDQLRSMLVGIIQAPASKLARVISTPGAQIARVIKAYSEK